MIIARAAFADAAGRRDPAAVRLDFVTLAARPSPASMRLYGFKSCDMVRAAIKWLDANGVAYTFFDYRREALDAATIDDWFARAGWETVFNRNSAAYRELSPAVQAALTPATARALILENTNLIKRPLLDTGSTILTGFNASTWAAAGIS